MAAEDMPVSFSRSVHQSEIESINKRRAKLGIKSVDWALDKPIYNTVGLSLSGGGIRSAAISLGVLQALDSFGALRHIDYLSTVSGGGYIGSSMTATMTATSGEFVYSDRKNVEKVDYLDSLAVAHLRNHSNYLISGRKHNLGSAVAIIVRGLIANLVIVAPILLFCSVLVVFAMVLFSFYGYFFVTVTLLIAGILLFLIWALYLSFRPAHALTEESSKLPVIAAIYLAVVALAFFVELQPFLIRGLVSALDGRWSINSSVEIVLELLGLVGIPFAILVALFQRAIRESW
jgi:hypothetical protein